jgi:D-alanine-D-alanine ligase
MKIAFLYNVRHLYPDPNDPKSQLEADFDDPETIEWMVKHFKNCGYDVLQVEADEKAYLTLLDHQGEIDLAFNYAEGIYGQNKYAHLPAMLEMLQIPFTGPDTFTQALVLNKPKAKEVLMANGIPTLPFQVFITGLEPLKSDFKYPLIVKPSAQGSSAGITNASVVKDEASLRQQLKKIIDSFKQPVMVESFLTGREFSIGLLDNPPKALPIIEADHSVLPKDYLPMDSLEVKWILEEENKDLAHLICPAKIEASLAQKLNEICLRAWEALGIRDSCRIDLRCDNDNNPYVLDINSPAGLIPPEVSMTSYFPLAARTAGIDYPQLLKTIVGAALKRYGQ